MVDAVKNSVVKRADSGMLVVAVVELMVVPYAGGCCGRADGKGGMLMTRVVCW